MMTIFSSCFAAALIGRLKGWSDPTAPSFWTKPKADSDKRAQAKRDIERNIKLLQLSVAVAEEPKERSRVLKKMNSYHQVREIGGVYSERKGKSRNSPLERTGSGKKILSRSQSGIEDWVKSENKEMAPSFSSLNSSLSDNDEIFKYDDDLDGLPRANLASIGPEGQPRPNRLASIDRPLGTENEHGKSREAAVMKLSYPVTTKSLVGKEMKQTPGTA